MAHTVAGKKKLLARVRRIQGQTAALERALDEGTDCIAVLQQIAAVRGAISGLMSEVLEGHLREHLGPSATDDATRSQDVEAVVSALRSYLK
ncbi:metal/formaldehyde-sensitive transcriptional repressor [Xylophilus sp. GOD-11R]|uniref:metal/formaldehyde-sensitive transcriptional repressor n=1 Tax=Xylophilus sp. GOD-11R TaxID=3089814 RepID=UPI00298C5DCA|nr:metal/formaldehyde-sensitive transcriptional repressor [Xylophilus sp. GOD-11R]WPB57667.1 metal/formaldehyde-sensitive transcriptional repressor [Xylophilus sp. GOD-11R]